MHRITAVVGLIVLLRSGPSFVAAQTEPFDSGDEPGELTGQFSMPLSVLISIFCTPLFIIVIAIIFVLWWRRDEATTSGPSLNVLQPRPPTATRGMDALAVDAFPAFLYADVRNLKVGKGGSECAICLSEFEDHEALSLLPKCSHVFHTQCIGAWLNNHATCPVCRCDLTAEPVVERITVTETNDIESQSGELRPEPAANVEPDQESGGHVSVTVEPVTRVKLLRWNSTGHLSVQPGENQNTDRFALKLPEEIRKQILGVGVGEESSRRGRKLNQRLSKSERWLVFKTSSFRWRN